MINKLGQHLILLSLIMLVSGCVTISKVDPDLALAPKGFIAPVSRAPDTAKNRSKEADLGFLDVYDPWSPMNRYIYSFNAQFDRAVYLPAVDVYTTVLPVPVRKGVTNAVNNLNEVKSFTNGILQISGEKIYTAFSRFLINSSIGLLGIMDIASDWGIDEQETGFADTLGVWGTPAGPYFVIPLLGPSSVRDATGELGDFALLWYEMNWVYDLAGVKEGRTAIGIGETTIRGLNLRANVPFRYYQTGSPFEYDLVRFLYCKKRELDMEKEKSGTAPEGQPYMKKDFNTPKIR
ncbi:MlaA family lipoprotein [Maridesulfovibrio hydrothermalis]|uniref:VacJ family lipoprotein n=1 Tax=Maridesulfovibrio hydrothermalis AM13 = DSM 14728 TaxID=1121451 RepID=L0RFD5_9BACT|nr:VacJ family lipoprotein [Maridesulfovibrio hydrothermalis]CCO25454.1 VacJ family lipoprotein [Maridesulfovibrio hydrothermalis AM13 = DSM 14728]